MKKTEFIFRSGVHSIFLIVSSALALIAKGYADQFGGTAIPDLVLDHIPFIDTSFFFYQGAFILVAVIVITLVRMPRYVPFTFGTIALLYVVRSCFMITTHLPEIRLGTGNDLFFSGHTALPFVLALIFWRYVYLRYFFIIASCIAGMSVLFLHMHYTIDVLGAYFISYTVYHIAVKIFKKEYEITR